jgi:hypothetical protein
MGEKSNEEQYDEMLHKIKRYANIMELKTDQQLTRNEKKLILSSRLISICEPNNICFRCKTTSSGACYFEDFNSVKPGNSTVNILTAFYLRFKCLTCDILVSKETIFTSL